ncbi:MAG: DUF1320 domain-containing protein [Bacteroidota bacterium]
MSYCTQNINSAGDIAPNRISFEQMNQLTNDEESGSNPQAVLDAANRDAATEIDGYCKRYVTPFNPVPDRIKSLAVDIVVHNLYKKRPSNEPEAVRKHYEDAIAFLKLVSLGRAEIPGAVEKVNSNSSVPTTGGYVKQQDSVFGGNW